MGFGPAGEFALRLKEFTDTQEPRRVVSKTAGSAKEARSACAGERDDVRS